MTLPDFRERLQALVDQAMLALDPHELQGELQDQFIAMQGEVMTRALRKWREPGVD